MPRKNSMVIITVSTEEVHELTLEELCSAGNVSAHFIQEMIEQGIIEPLLGYDHWRFNEEALRRVRTVINLQHDLEINLPGAALIIDLMDEIEQLRAKVGVLERYVK